MADQQAPLLSLSRIGIIVVLTGIFHLVMAYFLRAHVPTDSVVWQWVWAIFGATPLAGTFFLAACMFTMVLVDEKRIKAS